MASPVPRFIVMGFFNGADYLTYVNEGGESDGVLKFIEPQVTSPYAKFEVETSSSKKDLVHIRNCENNKYWQRTHVPSSSCNPLITATSKEKEEDESKESCTLFKFISVYPAQNKFRIVHVQSGCYVCAWPLDHGDYGLLSYYKITDHQDADVFTIIDRSSLLILPRHLAFKGDNDKYLCLDSDYIPYFGSDDIGESTAAFEILPTNDGKIRIKSSKTGKFFRCENSKWVYADSEDTSTQDVTTLFRPVQVDDKTIALINLGDNNFCKRLTSDGYGSALAAVVTSVTNEARLRAEEPVLTREIYNIKYDLDNYRIYGEQVLLVDKNSATNRTDQPSTMGVKLSYRVTQTSTWKNDISLTLGMKTTVKFDIPLIMEGSVELSAQVQSGVEWGKEFETSTDLEVVHTVTVPPMTMVTVKLIATRGFCDVPFTYMQRDTLYDGSIVLTQVQGGTYFGSNYYNMDFETSSKKLAA